MTGYVKSYDNQQGAGVILSSSGEEITFRERGIDDRRWTPKPGTAVTFDVVVMRSGKLAVGVVAGIRWRSHGSS